MLIEYGSPGELPRNLLLYGASDHAVSVKRSADPACVGVFGVDEKNDIWILPDLAWSKMGPDGLIEAMIAKITAHRPLMWGAEDDIIGKTLGPAIRRRMEEAQVYTTFVPVGTGGDKITKSANIQAQMSLGKVHFPGYAPWWGRAKSQMLMFPNYFHYEFVDFLGIAGRLLDYARGRAAPKKPEAEEPWTYPWLKKQTDAARAASSFGERNYASL
jgi:predicted phage terminase large subunit-like protein